MRGRTAKAAILAAEKYTEVGAAKREVKVQAPIVPKKRIKGQKVVMDAEYFARLDLEVEAQQEARRTRTVVVPKEEDPKIKLSKQITSLLGELDEFVDEAFEKKNTPKFNIIAWLKEKNFVDDEHIEAIKKTYSKHRAELQEAYDKVCPQMVEGYSFLNPTQKKKILDFFDTILNGCDDFLNLRRRKKSIDRKPHFAKPLSVQKQVKTLKYMKEAPEFGVISISPQDIVGAKTLWLFNTAYKQLSYYQATDYTGFKVKGCSLLNWDTKSSKRKSLRKPLETLKAVMGANGKEIQDIMDKLTTKSASVNGRINDKVIILKVGKELIKGQQV